MRARVTLAGGLTFCLVDAPGRVTRLPGVTFFEVLPYLGNLACI